MKERIQMTTPLVEMDGDEMTRNLWKKGKYIITSVLFPLLLFGLTSSCSDDGNDLYYKAKVLKIGYEEKVITVEMKHPAKDDGFSHNLPKGTKAFITTSLKKEFEEKKISEGDIVLFKILYIIPDVPGLMKTDHPLLYMVDIL